MDWAEFNGWHDSAALILQRSIKSRYREKEKRDLDIDLLNKEMVKLMNMRAPKLVENEKQNKELGKMATRLKEFEEGLVPGTASAAAAAPSYVRNKPQSLGDIAEEMDKRLSAIEDTQKNEIADLAAEVKRLKEMLATR